MNILFLHPNMPGQYKHLARAFGAEGGHRIFFVTKHRTAEIPGVERITYRLPRDASPHSHRYLVSTERAVLQGQEVWRVCKRLKTEKGFVPDIVVAHPGWGDALFIKDVFPKARVLGFFEFYYRAHGADVAFDPEEKLQADDLARVRIKNITNLLSLEMVDWGISPTVWQWSMHPPEFRPKISVLHDGVNTDICRPDPNAVFTLANGKSFRPGDELVTYIARNFEPYRGFPTFMHTAEILLKERPNAHIVAVGADEVSYGKPPPKGMTYRKMLMKEVKLPADRIHFIGTVPYDDLIRLFQVSAAHLYLTYPFVLSWSMLEAMASGVALVASDTMPVREVVEDGRNALFADFFSPKDVAKKLITLLDSKDRNAAMRKSARETVVARFDLKKVLPLHMQLVRDLSSSDAPPPTAAAIAAFNPVEPHRRAFWHGE
jgi:glycosyltransferase involved in cell wall biosynthesis